MEQIQQMNIQLKQYQDIFLYSTKRFPSMVSAVGTGKSMMLLLKIWNYCEAYPDSLALIVRKEFTDLRDSTIKDFQTYFSVTIDANKEYKFANGSTIMFRHGAEMAVLKNMNLSIAGIEQAEEFETDDVFTFLRDRLRRQNGPYRQLCVIANSNGHNYLWRLFIQQAQDVRVLDEETGQIVRERGEYLCIEANTLANKDNLPDDFIADLMRMKEDAPNHFMRYVMNSHEEIDADDLLFTSKEIYDAPNVNILDENRTIKRVMGVDCARYGDDETVFSIIEQKDLYHWEQVLIEHVKKSSAPWIVGRVMELERKFNLDLTVIDDVGFGGGVTDHLTHNRILPFVAQSNASVKYARDYEDNKTESYFMLDDLLKHAWIKLLPDHIQAEQLMTIRFTYHKGKKKVLGKDEMRRKYKELDSPDRGEALAMAVYGTDKRPMRLEEQRVNLPTDCVVDGMLFTDRYNQLPANCNMDGDDTRYYPGTNLPTNYIMD